MNATSSDLEAFAACFARNDTPRRLDALGWQYFDNPTGELIVDLAMAEGRVAAIYAVQPASFLVRGEPRLAAQSVDTLVDGHFRGRGLFTATAESVYQRVRDADGAFVYGFPNASSAPGFFGRLGWVSLDPVPFLLRPLRTAFLTSKLPLARRVKRLPDFQVPIPRLSLGLGQNLSELADLDTELDSLWDRFSKQVTIAVDRSARYLRWRLSKAGEQYHRLGIFERGRLVAFCAFTTVDKHGGRVGYVLELFYDPGRHRAGAALLSECLRQMASDGADVALAWCFRHSPNARAYARAGFLPFPEKLRPIELHFGVRVLDESLMGVLADRSNWYISYCDSDTV